MLPQQNDKASKCSEKIFVWIVENFTRILSISEHEMDTDNFVAVAADITAKYKINWLVEHSEQNVPFSIIDLSQM